MDGNNNDDTRNTSCDHTGGKLLSAGTLLVNELSSHGALSRNATREAELDMQEGLLYAQHTQLMDFLISLLTFIPM
jgi:hypothetical protein